MFLASKIGWAGIAVALLAAVILAQAFPRSPAVSNSNHEGVEVFVIRNEIKKVQEILRDKGHYEGKVDGVFGLRTRASIRAYQKAKNLPITGKVDTQTADGLGVRPESKWDSSQSAGRQVGQSSDVVTGEFKQDKPAAGIRRAEVRASKVSQKEVSRATVIEDKRGSAPDK
jgi:peptidoglycan hydrolase-like protein with peptidoglycan-binding domain